MLRNCTIEYNFAQSFGAGLVITDSAAPLLIDSVINGNYCPNGGGGAFVSNQASPIFERVRFSRNSAGSSGGAVLVTASATPVFLTCEIEYNSAKSSGGGLCAVNSAKVTLRSSTFLGNLATAAGAARMADNAQCSLFSTRFINNTANNRGGAIELGQFCNATFVDCDWEGNQVAVGSGGGISITESSRADVRDSRFRSNKATTGGAISCQTLIVPLVTNCTFSSNIASTDGGALYISDASFITVTESHFECVHLNSPTRANYVQLAKPCIYDCLIDILGRISVTVVEEQLLHLEYRNQPSHQVSLSPTLPKSPEEHCSWVTIVV